MLAGHGGGAGQDGAERYLGAVSTVRVPVRSAARQCARRQVRQGPVDAGRAAGNDGDLCAAAGCGFRDRAPDAGRAAQNDDALLVKIHECLS
jgi:hypothetical protein